MALLAPALAGAPTQPLAVGHATRAEQVALVDLVEAAGAEAPPPVGGDGAGGNRERQQDGQEQQSGGHVATVTRSGSREHQQ
jgi:hypothetical protein